MSYLYSSGVVSVKEAKLLPREFFLNVLSCTNSLDAENLFRNAFHLSEEASVDEFFDKQERELFEFVAKEAPNEDVKNFFIFPLKFDNLSTICKAQLVGLDWENYVKNFDFLDNKLMASFVAKRDFSIFEKDVAGAIKDFFETHPPQTSSEKLDRYFKQNKYKIMRKMFKKSLLGDLTKLQCDMQNLSVCLRKASCNGLENDMVECGFLNKETLRGILDKDKYCVGQIGMPMLRDMAELTFEGKDVLCARFEKEKNMLLLKFCEPKRFDMDSAAQFVYYVLRKLAEIKNCRMCLLFVRNNISGLAKQMLIGV